LMTPIDCYNKPPGSSMSHRTGQVAETPARGVAMSADHPADIPPATWGRQSCRRARIQAGFGPGSSFSTLPDKLARTPALLLVPPRTTQCRRMPSSRSVIVSLPVSIENRTWLPHFSRPSVSVSRQNCKKRIGLPPDCPPEF